MAHRLLLAVLLSFSAQGVEVITRFEPGQKFQLTTTQTQPFSPTGPPAVVKSTVHLKVLEVTPTQTVIEWVTGASTYQNVPPGQETMVSSMGKARQGLRLEVIVDEKGAYQGLRNQKEAEIHARQSFVELRKALVESAPESARAQVEEMIASALSPESAVSSAGADARTYFAYSGMSFEAGKPSKTESTAPMILGGGEARMITEITLKSFDEKAAILVVQAHSQADPDSLLSLKRSLAKQFLPPGMDSKIDLEQFKLVIDETVLTTIDLKTGLVLKRQQDYAVEAGPAKITMSNLIELTRD